MSTCKITKKKNEQAFHEENRASKIILFYSFHLLFEGGGRYACGPILSIPVINGGKKHMKCVTHHPHPHPPPQIIRVRVVELQYSSSQI